MTKFKGLIIGGGLTGLAVGMTSNMPIVEAETLPGGICASYYIKPGNCERLQNAPEDGEAYRFEVGGGHWIFGGDAAMHYFLRSLAPVKSYNRKSSVYFHGEKTYVPYPIQNHLSYLEQDVAVKALLEIMDYKKAPFLTMKEWMNQYFGPTLCDVFFYPFHELYTANLYDRIAPQDIYKSPIDRSSVIKGAISNAPPVGYNTSFVYPLGGLTVLAQRMAGHCHVLYNKCVKSINPTENEIAFEDGDLFSYDILVSTLPLNNLIKMTGLSLDDDPPYTSVLVLNIGAIRGNQCPNDHWLYTPKTKAHFHRVGFYSNVDTSFLPLSSREHQDKISIYVEKAYPGSAKPSHEEIQKYGKQVIQELQEWEFIRDEEVVDPTWIDIAYTWSWPESKWRDKAIRTLEKNNIFPVGRYGRWNFIGIADSIRDGLLIGSSLMNL